MFPMAGPGDLSRMMVHLRETVLMMHRPWLRAPSVPNKRTRAHVTHTHTHTRWNWGQPPLACVFLRVHLSPYLICTIEN